eukprot:scaffold69_cov248-Pinguiococcus_pyrenoidosus.AAC.80
MPNGREYLLCGGAPQDGSGQPEPIQEQPQLCRGGRSAPEIRAPRHLRAAGDVSSAGVLLGGLVSRISDSLPPSPTSTCRAPSVTSSATLGRQWPAEPLMRTAGSGSSSRWPSCCIGRSPSSARWVSEVVPPRQNTTRAVTSHPAAILRQYLAWQAPPWCATSTAPAGRPLMAPKR